MKGLALRFIAFHTLPIRWYWLLLTGMALAVFQTVQQFTRHELAQYNFEFSWGAILSAEIVNYLIWFFMLPVIYTLTQRVRWPRMRRAPLMIPATLGLFGFLTAIHRLLVSRLIDYLNLFRYGYLREFVGPNSLQDISVGLFSSAIELLAIMILLSALLAQQRVIEQQKILARAQLNALRMQLNPHFLFNTLHSIASLIDIDVRRAQKMLTKLGTLLRKVLESDDKQFVLLRDELAFIQEYLDIEQVRFEELHVSYDIENDSWQHPVPSLILQPLVENAIKFGMGGANGKSEIAIRAGFDRTGDHNEFRMEVENNLNPDRVLRQRGMGIGLQNVRKRLTQLYDSFSLETDKPGEDRFLVRITIPVA